MKRLSPVVLAVLLSPSLSLAQQPKPRKGAAPPPPTAATTQAAPSKPPPAPAPARPATPAPRPGALDPNAQATAAQAASRWGRRRYAPLPMGVAALPNGEPPLVVGTVGGSGAKVGAVEEPEADPRHDADLSLSSFQTVNLLADPMYSDDGKLQTERELMQGGITVVPALVEKLGDKRVFTEREAPGPDGRTVKQVVTVGEECEMLLYHVITPHYRSPHEKALPAGASQVMFTVPDWGAWWKKNQHRKLSEIHADMKQVIDQYWQQGGVEQKVQ